MNVSRSGSHIADREQETDDEIRRLQDGIRDHLISLGAPDDRIDGAGCDSGDPLDFTKAEITQAFNYFEDQVRPHGDRGGGEANERALRILNEEMRASAERECELLQACLRDMMRIYESRIRSLCNLEQLKQQPWRVAEYVAAEEALATKESK